MDEHKMGAFIRTWLREARVEAFTEAAEMVHVERFALDDGTAGGPDNFYNGAIYSERLLRNRAQELSTDD